MDQIQIKYTDTLRLIGYIEIRAVQLRTIRFNKNT